MAIEYKSVGVTHVEQVHDEGDGIVSAFVSVTGIEDNVKDVILPGAYEKTLQKRTPKGVWGHQWNIPTARTIEAKELRPGDPELPKKLPNGDPWPAEAGALRIKMQFNLATQRGREAYADVTFFGDQQEWSIGYQVPEGKAYKKDGKRYIKELNLFEYSPVLFGAMSHARTANSVKEAQFALMESKGLDTDELIAELDEYKSLLATSFDESADSDDDDDEYEEGKLDIASLRSLAANLEALLNDSGYEGKSDEDIFSVGLPAYVEAKATEYSTVLDAVSDMTTTMTKSDLEALERAAEAMDDAVDAEDADGAEEAAMEVLNIIEKVLGSSDSGADSARVVARVVADRLESLDDTDSSGEEATKTLWFDEDGNGFKSFSYGSRYYGKPAEVDGDFLTHDKSTQQVYIGTLDNDVLLSLDYLLKSEVIDPEMKSLVRAEVRYRLNSGDMTVEEKENMNRGRGGGNHRMRADGCGPGNTPKAKKPDGRQKKKPRTLPKRGADGKGTTSPDSTRQEKTVLVEAPELKSMMSLLDEVQDLIGSDD